MENENIRQKYFSTRNIVLIPLAIAINMSIGQLVSLVKLPIFLDSIGTVTAALLGGPVIGALTGLLTNLIWGLISSPVAASFAPVALVIGLATGLCAKYGLFRSWWKVLASGLIIALAASITAVPIRLYLFGGVTGSGADFLTAYLLALGKDLTGSVILTVITSNVPDKIVTAFIGWFLLKGLSKRFLNGYPFALNILTSENTTVEL
jgi:energy-coupling factor transport system substrate-specific component